MEHAAREKYGRYEVIEALAEGAMGSIYLAKHPDSGDLVAIKTFHPDSGTEAATGQAWESMLREAQVAKLLSHPNIVAVLEIDAGEGGDPPFVVMEYVQGTNLAELLAAGIPLPTDFTLSVTRQLADALDHAHLKGVVHGDVKPGNVLITDDETARLIDFGIAHLTGEGAHGGDHPTLGTPRYTSPEQAQGKEIGRRADVFSLGVVAYEMLTGQPAFSGENSAEVMWKIARGMPDRLPSEIDELSPQVQSVLAQALHVDPAGRYASAGDFAAALLGASDPVAQAQPDPRSPTAATTEHQAMDQVSTQDLSELVHAVPPNRALQESRPESGVLELTRDEVHSLPDLEVVPEDCASPPEETGLDSRALPENGVFGHQDRAGSWKSLLDRAGLILQRNLDGIEWWRTALVGGTALLATLLLGLLSIWLIHPGDFDNLGFSAEHRLRQRIVPLLKEGHRLLLEDEPAIAARVFARAEDIAPHLDGITELREQAERQVALQEQVRASEEEFAVLFEEGSRALRVGRYEKATQVSQRLLELDPENADALELAHRVKTARTGASRREQAVPIQREPEAAAAEPQPRQLEPIRVAPVSPRSAQVEDETKPETRPDWTRLKVDLFSYLPKGVVTVYADDDQILLQPFRFTEKGRLFLKKGSAGRLEAEQRLSAGDTEFRIYVSAEGRETQIVNLPVSLIGGETHVLRIIVAENGSTSAQLD